jgi:hypothetical protein
MAITYPLNIPSLDNIETLSIQLENVVGVSTSPFTFAQQVYAHQGQRWTASISTHPLPRASIEAWRAWLASLMGAKGTFLMGDPMGQTPRGSAGGTPIVDVASQSGNTLTIVNGQAGAASWLIAGDYLQLGTGLTAHMHRVLQTVTTSSNGAAVIEIWPRMRSSPGSGDTVAITSTVGVWRVVGNSENETFVTPNNVALSFDAVEAI